MSLSILISNSSGVPIYEQISEQMKQAILDKTLTEGDSLPSIRQLASDLRVSVMTANRAYTELEAQGYLVTAPGRGSFVAGIDNQLIREQLVRRIEEAFSAAISAARLASMTKPELAAILDLIWEGENND